MSVATRALCAVALVSVVVASGCSGSSDASEPAASATSSDSLLPEAEGVTEYPLTVTSEVGEIVVEQRPERVVMGSSWDADLFAALDVVPVATDEQIEFYPWAVDALPAAIEAIWPMGDAAYPAEQIADTNPDLIVDTQATDAEEVRQVSDIAPVLGAPEGTADTLSWRDRILLLGEVLDLSNRAQQVIDDYDATFEDIRAEHPEFAGKTVDLLVLWGGGSGTGFLNTAGSDQELLMSNLGFAPNSNAGNEALAEGLPDELIDSLTGDVLVVSNQAEQSEFDAFYGNPLVQRLPSVQNGRDVVLDWDVDTLAVTHDGQPQDFTGHFGRAFGIGPLAHVELAELLVPLLSEKLR
ncbi:ABC transporter substrate-binding protein [Rhodococcoides kyotonense]|uniref:Iron complex transport system substrate-binding protein n=1 Tax=Rhodococcoides kyotonense TaxID=398843 RepID=A0A239LA35_9NOCA|nr:ABC transporter substrate-binding protein [Rhodococcus kyotonensis]SNT26394.1 iron complex transport system substrate-binding protein [Rhodococcus kyotonensis]